MEYPFWNTELPLLASIRDPLIVIDRRYQVVWMNRASTRLSRRKRDTAIGRNCFFVFHGRTEPCSRCPMDKVRATGRGHVAERWMDFPDGMRRWGEVRAYPVFNERGMVEAIISIVIDITDKKQQQERHKKHREMLSKTISALEWKALRAHAEPPLEDTPYKLTGRELEVLRLVADGFTNIEISKQLSISPHTVKSHVIHLFNKLGVNDRTQAAVLATRRNLI